MWKKEVLCPRYVRIAAMCPGQKVDSVSSVLEERNVKQFTVTEIRTLVDADTATPAAV